MRHRDKARLARKNEGKHKKGYSIFDSDWWLNRKAQIRARVLRREAKPKPKYESEKS